MSWDKPPLDPDVLAALAACQAPAMPEPTAVAGLKARILAQARQGPAPATPLPPTPEAPQATLTVRTEEGDWVVLAPKVEMKLLRQDAQSRSFLLRLHPGAVLPPHQHPLDEECYCLEGEVRFGDLAVRAGDYHLAPRGVPHGAMRSRTGALLFLRGANPPQAVGPA